MHKFKSLFKRLIRSRKFAAQPGSKDPVCGMQATDIISHKHHNGATYKFCSDHCKDEFIKDPTSYV